MLSADAIPVTGLDKPDKKALRALRLASASCCATDRRATGRGRGGDDDGYCVLDDRLLTLHVSLGILIIVLALARFAWRTIDGLPPWAAELSPGQRIVATWTERCLLGLLIVIPAKRTGWN